MQNINIIENKCSKNKTYEDFTFDVARNVNLFHQTFDEYRITPLVELPNLARQLNIKDICVKDESFRFGLNAFKVLGASYAIGKYLQNKYDIEELKYKNLINEKIEDVTFVTATDGNHGRGVAWIANKLKQKAVVYLPSGSSLERLNNIKNLGAEAYITDLNYDDAVRLARDNANKNGWVLIQDTNLENYDEIPKYIMQGYTTMAYEISLQLKEKPTHIFLQAGVGAMAGAVTAFFMNYYKDEEKPIIVIVEPDKANCIYQSVLANDNKIHIIKGNMNSIMAGLCCGEPCSIGYDILKDNAEYFVSISDEIAKIGMKQLAYPISNDEKIISGESGGATTGLLIELLSNPIYEELKNELKLNKKSSVLCISTEGDTDAENYQRIINEK